MSEIQRHEPERPNVKDRINAVLLTLNVNRHFKTEAAIAAAATIEGIAYPHIIEKYPLLKELEESTEPSFMDAIPDGAKPIIAAAGASYLAIFGRPVVQTLAETIKAREYKAKEFDKAIYDKSFIPYLTKAWRTGELQLRDTELKSKEQPSLKEKVKKVYRRYFPPKEK